MLKSKVRTQEETGQYLRELREWLASVREAPVERMEAFFAKRVGEYESVHLGHWGEEYAHFADWFDDGLGSLLDVGCGTGLELKSIFARFPDIKVTGVDLSAVMLQKLAENYPDKPIELICGDYFACPLGAERFDAAASFETLHHFPADQKRALYRKLFSAIKPGGYYVECDYTACSEEEEALCLEAYRYRREKAGVPDGSFVHIDIPLTADKQRRLLIEAGFSCVETLYENCGTTVFKARKA